MAPKKTTPAPTDAAPKAPRVLKPFTERFTARLTRAAATVENIRKMCARSQIDTAPADLLIHNVALIAGHASKLAADFVPHRIASAFGPTLLKGAKVQFRDAKKAAYKIFGAGVDAVFTVDMVSEGKAQISALHNGVPLSVIVSTRDIKQEGTVEVIRTAEEKAALKTARIAKKAAKEAAAAKAAAAATHAKNGKHAATGAEAASI